MEKDNKVSNQQKFILGFVDDGSVDADNPEKLTLFKDEKTADYESSEWVTVYANTETEARAKWHETFKAWQDKQNNMKPNKVSSHTPGEWEIVTDMDKILFPDGIFIAVKNEKGIYQTPICEVHFGQYNKSGKANAELIASAPTLKQKLNDEETRRISAEVALEKVVQQRDFAIKEHDYMVKQDQKHRDLYESTKAENEKLKAEIIKKGKDLETFLDDLLREKSKTDEEFDEAQGLWWQDKIRHLIGM